MSRLSLVLFLAVSLIVFATPHVEAKRRTRDPAKPATPPQPPTPPPAAKEPEPAAATNPFDDDDAAASAASTPTARTVSNPTGSVEAADAAPAVSVEAAPQAPKASDSPLFPFRDAAGANVFAIDQDGATFSAASVSAAQGVFSASHVVAGGSVFAGADMVATGSVSAKAVAASDGAQFGGPVSAASLACDGTVQAKGVIADGISIGGVDLAAKVAELAALVEEQQKTIAKQAEQIAALELAGKKHPALVKKVDSVIQVLSRFDIKSEIDSIKSEQPSADGTADGTEL